MLNREVLEAQLAELELEFDMSEFGFDIDETSEVEQTDAPDGFKEYGEDMDTKHVCPRCGYEWN